MSTLIVYVPVLHKGYLELVRDYKKSGGEMVILLDKSILNDYDPTHKDIHGLEVEEIAQSLGAIEEGLQIDAVRTKKELARMLEDEKVTKIVAPNEEAMRRLAEEEKWPEIEWKNVWLRWDREKAREEKEARADEEISEKAWDEKMMAIARGEGQKSADWWRRVGAVAVRGGKVLMKEHNTHLPDENIINIEGDIRAQFHKGEMWELGTSIHAEAKLIAKCAREGIKLEEAEMYLTDFPCPNCAKLIAQAGIKKIYYKKGYALSDGERVLKSAGVKIVRVV